MLKHPLVRGLVGALVLGLGVGALAPGGVGASGGKMYWFQDPGQDEITIQRANLDGTGKEDLFPIDLLGAPQGIAVDMRGRKMYWTDASYYDIERANLDGSGRELVVDTWPNEPAGIALDVAGGKMYWTVTYPPKIQRATLDGSGIEDVITGLNDPEWIALDTVGGKMYWTEQYPGIIRRANLDGSGLEDLVTGIRPGAIALDVATGKMYWTVGDQSSGRT